MRPLLVAISALVLSTPAALGAGRGEPGPVVAARVELRDRAQDLALFTALDLDVDGVFGSWARLYLVPEEIDKLRQLGFTLSAHDPGMEGAAQTTTLVPSSYHTYETLTAELQEVAADHPAIARLVSIGQSVQGRELWMVKISDNPDLEEDEPEVRYIAAMHGDEVVGKEMCVNLTLRLLVESVISI